MHAIRNVYRSENALKGKVGKKAYLENWNTTLTLAPGESAFQVSFEYEESVGVPGAIIVTNHHTDEFFLKSITLEDYPGQGTMHFDCQSWVYPFAKYDYERIFFLNKVPHPYVSIFTYLYYNNI